MSAIVCKVVQIKPHPDPETTRLEIVTIAYPPQHTLKPGTIVMWPRVELVTGPHYEVGQRGLYLPPGTLIPGYLAEDLWLLGRASANAWYEIKSKNMRGVESPGMFAGERYQPDRAHPFKPWAYWRDHWKEGEDVAPFLGIQERQREFETFIANDGQVALRRHIKT